MKCLEDYNELQHDIDLFHHWTTENFLKFNVSKCKYMVITKKRHCCVPSSLHLESTALERVHAYKYLGVLITSNISWSEHINSVCIKVGKVIGVLYRHFYANIDWTTLLKLYIALVRPHLEYACQVWNLMLINK